jgi:hypothetical protein
MGYFDKGQLRPDPRRGLKPPPDYSRRSVKIRIFVLIAALFLVVAVAERARDPNTWKWLQDLDSRGEKVQPPVNPRLQPSASRTEGDSLDTFIASADDSAGNAADHAAASPSSETEAAKPKTVAETDPTARAWRQGWKDVYDLLEPEERRRLYETIYAARQGQPLPGIDQNAATELVHKLDTQWKEYQSAAFQSIVELSKAEQDLWTGVLRTINDRWSSQVQPALAAAAQGETLSSEQQQALATWQRTLDDINLKQVQDDRVFVPSDREILFRLFGEVRTETPEQLRNQSVGEVGYMQLFQQPNDYRGKAVTVRGTARLAYHLEAPPNHLGIRGYYVYWLHPAGGPDSPIVIYALEAPPGFPEIKDRDKDKATTKLHETMEVTGFFLKRWAYRGKDGTYTAPLLIARAPQWDAAQSKLAHSAGRETFGMDQLYVAAAVALAISTVIFAVIYLLVRRREKSIERLFNLEEEEAAKAALKGAKLRPTTEESLRQMSREM